MARKFQAAQNKIGEGKMELSSLHTVVEDNLDILAHAASMDYTAELQRDLLQASTSGDIDVAKIILDKMGQHQETMKIYAAKARENVGDYIDRSTGDVDLEKLKRELNAFIKESFVVWYGEENASKAKISGEVTPLSKIDYEAL